MNFLKLCKMKYYNLNLVFSVERNFIAQMGDPSATGRGGETSIFQREWGSVDGVYQGDKIPILSHVGLPAFSCLSCGNLPLFGSQFFITLGENLDSLDAEHLVFGKVVEGLEVICKLNQTLTDDKNRPYQDIRISHTVILDDPYPDPKEVEFPDESPKPTREVFESDYIAADETIDDTEGKTMVEIQEEIEEREARARATILEMVGDLPDADMAPPENVLFVCKLNPVTTSEDLEIIFSRFGKINSCEVIRDRITNNSLHYAFIEFGETKSCEDAYFKMDNVLIDDRRIHVDFSQSVSKIKWRGKGRGVEFFDDNGQRVDDKKGQRYDPSKDHSNQSRNRNKNARDSRHIDHGQPQVSEKDRKSPQRQQSCEGNSRDKNDAKHFSRNEKNGRDVQVDRCRMEKHKKHESSKRSHVESEDSDGLPSDEEAREKMLRHLKKSLKKKKKKHKHNSESDTDDSDEKKKKKNKKKKKRKKRSENEKESDSDSESKKKSKKGKKKKKKKKKENSSSDSHE
ncbi:peptidyl-prolyl cis-trans isomerase sig-7 [Cherax quadricarinatus]|uniref:peptidyl-prolyl cis-trans isomerase sig-7 n=1 Tax=Cherax quadricarinatus TaxID=27406 RepID=UPI00387E881F